MMSAVSDTQYRGRDPTLQLIIILQGVATCRVEIVLRVGAVYVTVNDTTMLLDTVTHKIHDFRLAMTGFCSSRGLDKFCLPFQRISFNFPVCTLQMISKVKQLAINKFSCIKTEVGIYTSIFLALNSSKI